jgi:hypothetical protein
MSAATLVAPRSAPRRSWSRLWPLAVAQPRPTAELMVCWQLVGGDDVALEQVRVRVGRVPGAWADSATVRPSGDGSLRVVLRLPVEVWAAPAVLDFTVTLLDPASSRAGRTYSLTTAEPFFWNGTDSSIDIELVGDTHEDGTVEPRVADVLVTF